MDTHHALVAPPSPSLLQAIQVRPVEHDERSRWHDLLARHHYLGTPALVGKSLLHVATLDGQWVALLGWSSPALKYAARDRWIGWLPVLQWQRLHFIVNNTRILILPDFHLPNLASRVLGLSLQRLSDDWERLHGQPVLLAETFVDPSRFTGTSYQGRRVTGGWTDQWVSQKCRTLPISRSIQDRLRQAPSIPGQTMAISPCPRPRPVDSGFFTPNQKKV